MSQRRDTDEGALPDKDMEARKLEGLKGLGGWAND